MVSWQEMPSEAEQIIDGAVDRKKPLGLSRRFEPAHMVLSLTR
jgi:hypothetical protein